MAKAFRASKKRNVRQKALSIDRRSAAVKHRASIGKGKILAVLIPWAVIVAVVYIVSVSRRVEFVFHLYWILTAALLCVIAVYDKLNIYRYTKEQAEHPENREASEKCYEKNRRRIKYLLIFALPFLFMVLADTVYLMFLADSGIAEAVSKLF